MVQEKSASRKAHDPQDAIERLRKHALNFSADKTRGGEIEVRERQHVAFHAALFFFIKGHDHQHGDESGGNGGGRLETDVVKERGIAEEGENNSHGSPHDEGNGKEPVRESLLAAAFQPEDIGHGQKNRRRRKNQRKVKPTQGDSTGPENQDAAGGRRGHTPERA